jgi:hypothetical protein
VSDDPQWPRASAWLASGGAEEGRRLGVVGVPLSRTSISASGAHETPAAVRAALRRVEEEVLRDHVAHCVEHAIASGDKNDQRAKIAELMDVIRRAER